MIQRISLCSILDGLFFREKGVLKLSLSSADILQPILIPKLVLISHDTRFMRHKEVYFCFFLLFATLVIVRTQDVIEK